MVSIEEQIRVFALKHYPEEACGVVVMDGKHPIAIDCKNVSADPLHTFQIEDQYLEGAMGVWHSHPSGDPTPSDDDRTACVASGLVWYIMGVKEGVTTPLKVVLPAGESEYLERPYVLGTFDCWSLVKDFYRREFCVLLGDYPRENRAWVREDLFSRNWRTEGFVPVELSQLKDGDLVLIGHGPVINHIGVFHQGKFMHHVEGRLSRMDELGGYWLTHARLFLRYQPC